MTVKQDLQVWRIVILTILLAEGDFGRPHRYDNTKNRSIVKRVEISGADTLARSQVASRRQNVIHAGEDYDSDEKNKPEIDELENLGKIVDYNGKIIEDSKPIGSKWKDTTAISKDVIERIKEIQDSLIKRSGGKNLAEKLKLLQPEKNITIASADSNGVSSRKIIPEDVVNKILEKFQELRSQASELAKLDQRTKSERHEAEKEPKKEEKKEESKEKEKPKDEADKSLKPAESKEKKPLSPYESIGPPKENEEVRNITQHSISESQMNIGGNQDILKTSSSADQMPQDAQERGFMQQQQQQQQQQLQLQNNAMFSQQQQNMMPQNMPGNMMMMGGNVPMMFIRSGQMLVPVFGGQNGPMFGGSQPGPGLQDRPAVEGRSNAQMMSQMMGPPLVPQQPMIEGGQSRSGPQLESRSPGGAVQIPSVPYSMIMSLMSAPGMMSNLPATPPQMNGVLNVPQSSGMNAAEMMQQASYPMNEPAASPMNEPAASPMNEPTNGEQTGLSRSFGFPGQQSMPEAEQASAFMGGLPGQMSPTAGAKGPVAVSMDMSGRLSMLNSISPAFSQPQGQGPLVGNPFQDTHSDARNGMEVLDKEKQMLNPALASPVNDLSDPIEEARQSPLRNINPDALLELAKIRSTESENPSIGDPRTLPRDPDTLLDTLHMRQLNGGLNGAGDPDKFGMQRGMQIPFDGSNPETLLDMLSKRKSSNMNNNEVMNWEREQENHVFGNLKAESNAFGRGHISEIGTNGMQSVSSLPTPGMTGVDPSFADVVGNQPFDIGNRNVAGDNPVESSFFRPRGSNYNNGHNFISVVSHDNLRYENSKNAIDSGENMSPIKQADVFVRHNIMGSKRSKTTLHDDNIELKVNGKPLAETGSLRSKIVNGKVKEGHGKTLTSKKPVRIELSHSNDAKKTKVINIITSGKFKVTESRRDKIMKKKDSKEKNILKKFYRGS